MTVREAINTIKTSGSIGVFNDRRKMYIPAHMCWDSEVRRVAYHRGYGFGQVNAVIHIIKK